MAERSGIITLLTDFGIQDPFVGVMKGVILGIFPGASLIDLTHQIGPQDVSAAAWTLRDSYSYFPKGTVHLCVVDPGVGSERKPIALLSNGHFFVGPDNGLFTSLYPADVLVELNQTKLFRPEVSVTFHGRDIFAPVAAHIAKGLPLTEAGSPLAKPIRLQLAEPHIEDGIIYGQVIETDLFGNLITNIPADMVPDASVLVLVDDKEVMGIGESYHSLAAAFPGAIVGSHGRIEIALKNGSAADYLKVRTGARVEINII